MILTITHNSALDRVLFIDEFQPGTVMRPQKMIESVGGKGFDASVVLQALGVNNMALGFVAGTTGQQLVGLLDRYGLTHDLIWVGGETRIAHVLIETRHHRHSHIIAAGLSVSAAAYQALVDRYRHHLRRAEWVIAGGSLATGVPVSSYARLTKLARAAGVAILIDSFGQPLLATLPARPTIVKMNQAEFTQTFGLQAGTPAELVIHAQAVSRRKHLPALVITCGRAGLLAVTPAASYWAAAPPQQAVNAAGAGDGVSAALAWRLSRGDNWPDALRWAAATGAAITLTEGTADCHLADIERLLAQIEVRPL